MYGSCRSVCSKCTSTNKPTSMCTWFHFTIMAALIAVSSGQVTVTVSPTLTVDSGSSATLSCSYTIDDSYVFPLNALQWSMGETIPTSVKIALFTGDSDDPTYYKDYPSPPEYIATRDIANRISTFVIASVNFHNDSGTFWCRLIMMNGDRFSDSVDVIVIVLPMNITLSDETGAYPDGGTSYLVEGEERQYVCVVPDIHPGATFTWTVGGQSLTPDGNFNINGSNGLTTSNSTITITAVAGNDGEMLQCQASNKNGHAGVSIAVVLDVKVPPKDTSMSLLDSSGPLEDTADVDEGTEHTFTCKVLGTRPAPTIKWFLNDVEQTTNTPSPGAGIGLVDTESQWTFTPDRVNHRKGVKCEANTAESELPFPSVSTALNVIGPPDTPVVSGNMGNVTMTENVATTLTCTADLGYPNDWVLALSNAGTAIGNPSETTAVLGTSQRYMFTRQLEFTPMRQDNTHLIVCSASIPSSTPLPEGTWGPINVQYETNITTKHLTEVGIKSGLTANLSCTAKGNPAPVITWLDPNNTEIIHGGNDNKYMVEVSYTTSDTDMTIGNVTTSKLTIQKVDGQVDYGVYTCNSINGIGLPDSHEINLNGTRRPNKPTGVVRTDRTSSSIAVSWAGGYDGGEPQWFHVGYKKTADSSETISDNKIVGGVTAYDVDDLESYTEYDIRVYAENELGRNPSPGSIVEYTLPVSVAKAGITIEFNVDEGTLTVSGLKDGGGCIQLEVKYEGNSSNWVECGECITADSEVLLADWCPQTQKRSRRAVGNVDDVQAKYCQGSVNDKLCSGSVRAERVTNPQGSSSGGIIAGGLVGGIFLVVIIIILIVYLRKTSPSDPKSSHTDTSSIELATDNFGRSGQVNEGLQGSDESLHMTPAPRPMSTTGEGGAERSAKPAAVERMVTDTGDTYALVNKEKPKDKSPPPNLPDVTYADVNKKAQAKRPKKYVPPSKADQESEYEDVRLPPQNMKSKIGAGASGYEVVNLDSPKTSTADEENDYADVSQHQSPSGRTVNEDGLIYMEVGHYKKHPVNQPPIQTEESTTYASIDFKRLVAPDVAK